MSPPGLKRGARCQIGGANYTQYRRWNCKFVVTVWQSQHLSLKYKVHVQCSCLYIASFPGSTAQRFLHLWKHFGKTRVFPKCKKHWAAEPGNKASVLAKAWKSGAPPLFSGSLFFDVVVRIHNYALIFKQAPLFATASG